MSMRDELLVEDYGYWQDDPAISYIQRICDVPAVTPEGVIKLRQKARGEDMPDKACDHTPRAHVGDVVAVLTPHAMHPGVELPPIHLTMGEPQSSGWSAAEAQGAQARAEEWNRKTIAEAPAPPLLSIREFTQMESFLGWMLMTTISKDDKASKAKFERILASAHDGTGDENTPRYKVELTINGERYDLRAFAKRLEEQLDKSIANEAGRIVQEKLGNGFFEIAERLQDTAKELATGMRQKAAEMLGFDPWKNEDHHEC